MVMKEKGLISGTIAYEEWQKKASHFAGHPDVQALRMAICRMDPELFKQMRYMDLFQTTGIRFDMTNTHACTSIRCQPDKELIKLYISQSYEAL